MARNTATRREVNNLIINGDFEYYPGTLTAPTTVNQRWIDGTASGSTTVDLYRWGTTSVSGSIEGSFDITQSKTGIASLKLSTKAAGAFVEAHRARLDSAAGRKFYAIPILPSTAYTCTYWLRTNYVSGDATNGAALQIRTYDGAFTAVGTHTGTYVKTTTDWTQYTISFTSTSTSRYFVPVCIVYGHQGTATLVMDAWFDDIRLGPTTPLTRSVA